jgi:hypothetical protein
MNLFTRKAASVAVFTLLGLTAGGIAWGQSASAPGVHRTVAAAASSSADDSALAAVSAARARGFGGLGKRVLHGEVVLQTKKGFVTEVIARGTATAVSGDSISVTSPDGVTTTFTLDQKTKARSAGQKIAVSAVHRGDKVGVLGVKTGNGAALARMIRKLPG